MTVHWTFPSLSLYLYWIPFCPVHYTFLLRLKSTMFYLKAHCTYLNGWFRGYFFYCSTFLLPYYRIVMVSKLNNKALCLIPVFRTIRTHYMYTRSCSLNFCITSEAVKGLLLTWKQIRWPLCPPHLSHITSQYLKKKYT